MTTLRDRTELTALRRELDVSRHTTDTLRAQAHEFVNRLHTIAGLVELGEHDEVVRYITRTSELHESLDREVTRAVRDPALAALLIAKASLAAEQGVALTIDDGHRSAARSTTGSPPTWSPSSATWSTTRSTRSGRAGGSRSGWRRTTARSS